MRCYFPTITWLIITASEVACIRGALRKSDIPPANYKCRTPEKLALLAFPVFMDKEKFAVYAAHGVNVPNFKSNLQIKKLGCFSAKNTKAFKRLQTNKKDNRLCGFSPSTDNLNAPVLENYIGQPLATA